MDGKINLDNLGGGQCTQREPYKRRQEGHNQRAVTMERQVGEMHFEDGRRGREVRTVDDLWQLENAFPERISEGHCFADTLNLAHEITFRLLTSRTAR